jgi:hypothetical protein
MARRVACVCGNCFHIGHGSGNVQCRRCGRWWSGQEMSLLGAVLQLIRGGEVAGAKKVPSTGKPRKGLTCYGKQTSKQQPKKSPVRAALRWLFG